MSMTTLTVQARYNPDLPCFGYSEQHKAYSLTKSFRYDPELSVTITLMVLIKHGYGHELQDVRVLAYHDHGDVNEVITQDDLKERQRQCENHGDTWDPEQFWTFEMLAIWGYVGCLDFVEDSLRRWEAIKLLVSPAVTF